MNWVPARLGQRRQLLVERFARKVVDDRRRQLDRRRMPPQLLVAVRDGPAGVQRALPHRLCREHIGLRSLGLCLRRHFLHHLHLGVQVGHL